VPADARVLAETGGFWDSRRSESCELNPFTDGIERCITTADTGFVNNGTSFYSDAACSQRLIEAYVLGPTCAPSVPIAFGLVVVPGVMGTPVDQVFAAGPVFVPTSPDAGIAPVIYYASSQGSCTEMTIEKNQFPYALYELGPRIDPDLAFMRVPDRTE
jgi:hypothetical protein